jgi:hypothetical protein
MPSCFAEFRFDMDKAAGKYQVIHIYTHPITTLLDAVDTLRALHQSNSAKIGDFFSEFYYAKVCCSFVCAMPFLPFLISPMLIFAFSKAHSGFCHHSRVTNSGWTSPSSNKTRCREALTAMTQQFSSARISNTLTRMARRTTLGSTCPLALVIFSASAACIPSMMNGWK